MFLQTNTRGIFFLQRKIQRAFFTKENTEGDFTKGHTKEREHKGKFPTKVNANDFSKWNTKGILFTKENTNKGNTKGIFYKGQYKGKSFTKKTQRVSKGFFRKGNTKWNILTKEIPRVFFYKGEYKGGFLQRGVQREFVAK